MNLLKCQVCGTLAMIVKRCPLCLLWFCYTHREDVETCWKLILRVPEQER